MPQYILNIRKKIVNLTSSTNHSVCVIDIESITNRDDNTITGHSILYNQVKKYLSDGFAVIYAVEPSSVNVIKSMSAMGIDTGNYIGRGMLTILDRNIIFSFKRTKEISTHVKLNEWETLIKRMKEKVNYDKLVMMTSTAILFETHNVHRITDYERSITEGFNQSVEIVCCYPQTLVRQLRLRYLMPILELHAHTIHNGWSYGDWNTDRIIWHINNGINRIVGQKGARIVLGNLKMLHNIDENMIIAHPEIFEERLRRMMGQSKAEKIIKSISEELEVEMKFLR